MEDENKNSGFQNPSSGKGKSLYINYYSADYLIEILEKNSFKVFDLRRKKYKDKQGNSITDLILIARKTVNNNYTSVRSLSLNLNA